MSDILILVAIVFGLRLFRLGQEALNIRSIQLPLNPKRLAALSDLPEFHRPLLEGARKELFQLGFLESHAEAFSRYEGNFERQGLEQVFVHPHSGCRAYLSVPDIPDGLREYTLGFVSEVEDGRTVRTTNAPTFFGTVASDTLRAQSAYSMAPAEQYRLHLEAAPTSPKWPSTEPEALCKAENLSLNSWFHEQCRRGVVSEAAGRVRFSLVGAWRASKCFLAQAENYAQAAKKAKRECQAAPVEVEVAAYEQLTQFQNTRKMKSAAKFLLFTLTALLFLASFGMSLSIGSVIILLVVLFIHELGHIAAMKAFGYRDLKILFLPFLGAVAMGRQKNVPTSARVIVSLAGPIPGIVVGLAGYALVDLFGLEQVPFLHEFLATTLVINFFNLLPIMPLDGGRVLHDLIFSRVPWLEATFSIIGALVLGGLAMFANEPVLAFVALLILISTKEEVRRSRLLKSFRSRMKGTESAEPKELARRAFGHLSEQGCQGLAFGRRYQLAEYLLSNVHAPAAGAATTGLLLCLYLVSLVLVPGYFAYTYSAKRAGSVHHLDGHGPIGSEEEVPLFDDAEEEDDSSLPERIQRI